MSKVYRATFKCDYGDGTLVQPSFHYQTDLAVGGGEPSAVSVADHIWTKLGTAFLNTLPSPVTCHELVAAEEVIPPDIGAVGSHTVAAVGTGFGTGNELPRAFVPLLRLNTGVRSRSARGHTFLCSPGTKTVVASGAIWDTSTQGFYNTLAALLDDNIMMGDFPETTLRPVIYSRTRRQRSQSPYTFNVTSASCSTHPTWLRSRATTP